MFMIDYIMKIKSDVDNLATIGEPIFDQDHIMNLLGGQKSHITFAIVYFSCF